MTEKKPWQIALSSSITDPKILTDLLQLNISDLPLMQAADKDFSLKIPRAWIEKINPADPYDPLLMQVLPIAAELKPVAGFEMDALQEIKSSPVPGLLHKYASRVLWIIAGSCAINCRYCFRRHFPYHAHKQAQMDWQKALDYIASNPEVNEVIFSGGEPLILPDAVFSKLVAKLGKIPHIKTLRIHSRMPVFIPERLDQDFLRWFVSDRFKSVLVVHVNHPNEIDAVFAKKMQALRKKGIVLFNQSVLLKGVNDNALVLKNLSERLFFECGIQPYYLNFLDKIKGVAHFAVTKKQARALYQELLGLLPGYLVPKLVIEIPGRGSKVPL